MGKDDDVAVAPPETTGLQKLRHAPGPAEDLLKGLGLWRGGILILLWLTFGLLLTPLLRTAGLRQLPLEAHAGSPLYYFGLLVLFVCLCLYLALSRREIRGLRSRISADGEELQGMALDLEGLRGLLRVTASITSEMELSPLLEMIVREAVKAVGAHESSLMLLDRSRTVLRTVAAFGAGGGDVRNARVRVGEGVAGWVAQHRKPLLLHGVQDLRELRRLVPKDRAIASSVCVPLQTQDRVLGVLNVNRLEPGVLFTDNEVRLLMIYANHASVAIRNASLLRASQERSRLRSILDGYVPPQVAEALMKNPRGWMNLGEVRDLTVLFADIRGFTSVVHRMGPQKTRLFLNQFFTRMTEIVFEHGGTLDKFIGDSVMAFFGAPMRVDAPALKALNAARSMVDAFADIQKRWAQRGSPVDSLSLGVGISTGHLFVGNVGSRRRFDYTVIGKEVNVASRLCDMATGGQILLCEGTRRALPPGVPLRHLGDVRFKGLDRPVHVFESAEGPQP